MGFKKSHKSAFKKCRKSREGQRGRGMGKMFKKAKRFVKKAINSNLGKLAISQELAHAPRLYFQIQEQKNQKIAPIRYSKRIIK